MPSTLQPAVPFTSDTEYFAAECSFLHSRAARIGAEVRAAFAESVQADDDPTRARHSCHVPAREAKCRAHEARHEEDRTRGEIDARLAVHRADPTRPKLAIDALCEKHGLSDQERLVLIAAAVPALSQRVADELLGDIGTFYAALSVSDLMALLDPQGVTDWIAFRKLFRASAALRKSGLLVIAEPKGVPGPDTLPAQEARLSMEAFAAVVGDPAAAHENDEAGDEP